MDLDVNLDATIKRYLLGTLPAADQQKLEERVMTQEEIFTQLLVQEDELIEEYLLGKLSPEERACFENHFLIAPERRQKLVFAQALTKYASAPVRREQPIPSASFFESIAGLLRGQRPAVQYSLAAAAFALLAVFSWSLREIWSLQQEAQALKTRQAASQSAEDNLSRQLAEEHSRALELMVQLKQSASGTTQSPSGPGGGLPVLSYPLMPGMVRDLEGMKKIAITPSATLVELRLSVIGEHYRSYRCVIFGSDGKELMALTGLTSSGNDSGTVVVPIPATVLGTGDYYVKLSGLTPSSSPEEIATYYFRVSKK